MESDKKVSLNKEANLLAEMMEERVINEEKFQKNFKIDLNFYKKYSIDLNFTVTNRFCGKKCYPRRSQFLKEGFIDLKSEKTNESTKLTNPIENINLCCGQHPDFIKDELPLAEKIFRVLLKNNNQALNVHKISKELGYYNLNNLFSLLTNDTFYGFKEVKTSKK